jgi:integrase
MARNLINAAHIRLLKPRPGKKLTKYHDGEGLYLWVHDNGKKQYKRWFFRYRFEGINKPEILLGAWPSIRASEAREKAEEMRQLLKNGIDPAVNRKAEKSASVVRKNSFEATAREWHAVKMADKSKVHKDRVLVSLEKDVFPYLGNRPIDEVTAPEVLTVLRRVENRGAIETAHRLMGRCSMVFRYAVATGRCVSDPTRDLKDALKPVVKKHLAAVIDPEEVGRLLRVIDEYQGSQIVRCALKFAPLVFVRPGELRQAEWADINLEAAEWSFTASKTNQGHIVPLSRQALEILKELQPLTGEGRYVFPGVSSSRPMSNNAILAAFRRMGIGTDEMTGHGWRATARTLLDEVLKFPPHIIEQQLAHAVRDPLGRAYNRTTHLEDRHKMMQAWADYLDNSECVNVFETVFQNNLVTISFL